MGQSKITSTVTLLHRHLPRASHFRIGYRLMIHITLLIWSLRLVAYSSWNTVFVLSLVSLMGVRWRKRPGPGTRSCARDQERLEIISASGHSASCCVLIINETGRRGKAALRPALLPLATLRFIHKTSCPAWANVTPALERYKTSSIAKQKSLFWIHRRILNAFYEWNCIRSEIDIVKSRNSKRTYAKVVLPWTAESCFPFEETRLIRVRRRAREWLIYSPVVNGMRAATRCEARFGEWRRASRFY